MEKKNINELKEGMINSEDVWGDMNNILLAKGAVLTNRLIEALREDKIRSISVEENKAFINKFREINEGVDKKFEENLSHPVMKYIALEAKEYLKLKLLKTSGMNEDNT